MGKVFILELYVVLTIYEVYSYYGIKQTDSKVLNLSPLDILYGTYKIPRGLEILDDQNGHSSGHF